MMIPVHCATCGILIGMQEYFGYGPDSFERTDYGEVRPNEDYGGEYDGEHYCYACSDIVTLAEDEEEAVCD